MEIRKLNLVMSYPVKWDLYQVMNNFVQNFYDAVGSEKFMEHFEFEYNDGTIVLKSDVGFSKEWLYFIGASSKRNERKVYAGKFGEGFKIASLVAYRDLKLGVQMESRDWKLTVTQADDKIDKTNIKVLAYQIEERPYKDDSCLILTNAADEHYKKMKSEIDHYYYSGNLRFGECIAKGDSYAVYKSVKNPNERRNYGSLFVHYQWRDSLHLPIVVCNHTYEISGDDRDRSILNIKDSNCAIREVFDKLNPFQALTALELCRPCWKNTYDMSYIRRNWNGMLEILIDKVAGDDDIRKIFLEKYGESIITTGFGWWTTSFKRKMAAEWFRKSSFYGTRKVVCKLFDKFDIPTMYELCGKNNGFDEDAEANPVQQTYIDVLKKAAQRYFSDLFCYESLPVCRILLNRKAPILGKAHSKKEDRKILNAYGLKVVTRVTNIYMQAELFAPEKFPEAFVVYLHELLHQYGGESSIAFKKALLNMNRIILEHLSGIKEYETKWRAVKDVTNKTGDCY